MHADTRQFLQERPPADSAQVGATELYEEYREWAAKRGLEPRTHAAFGTDLGVYFTRIRRTGGNRYLEHELRSFAEGKLKNM